MTLLKINRLLPIYISIVLLKFEVDIESQTKVRVRKPKNPIWPPGGHFESHREMVNIDEMQFGFVPGRGTTDAIFSVCQLQEKYIAAKKTLTLTS